jgi:methionine-rich copper-binding protein CopC
VIVLGLAGAGAVAAAGPSQAHGGLVLSTPVKDSSFSNPIDAVWLAFTERPPSFAYFTVTAPSGVRVDDGWSQAEPKRLAEPVREYERVDGKWEPRLYNTGFQVRIPVAHLPEPGQYVARYQSVSSDGDKVEGEVRFTYQGAPTPAPAGWQAPTDRPSPELVAAAAAGGTPTPSGQQGPPVAGSDAGTDGRDGVASLSTWLVPALILLAGGFAIAGVARRPARRPATRSGGRPPSRPARRSGR